MGTRFGYESRADNSLQLDFWLTVGRGSDGGHPSVKATAGYPQLGRNERAINLKIKLPLSLFTLPSLTARIEVDEPVQAISIDTSAIAEAVRGAIGMDVDIQVHQQEQPS